MARMADREHALEHTWLLPRGACAVPQLVTVQLVAPTCSQGSSLPCTGSGCGRVQPDECRPFGRRPAVIPGECDGQVVAPFVTLVREL